MVKEVKVSELRKLLGIKKLKSKIKVSDSEVAALKGLRAKGNLRAARSTATARNTKKLAYA